MRHKYRACLGRPRATPPAPEWIDNSRRKSVWVAGLLLVAVGSSVLLYYCVSGSTSQHQHQPGTVGPPLESFTASQPAASSQQPGDSVNELEPQCQPMGGRQPARQPITGRLGLHGRHWPDRAAAFGARGVVVVRCLQ